jgi:hypothetical protein
MDGGRTAERRLMRDGMRGGMPADGWIERMRRMDMDGDG